MSIYGDLLSIKDFRESRAELAVRKQRDIFKAAVAARDAAERILAEFRVYALQHEKNLYELLSHRIVRLREIEDFRQEVSGLRLKEYGYEEVFEAKKRTLPIEQQRLTESVDLHAQAFKVKQKFVEFARIHADECVKELERKEDSEMEEMAELRRERLDWDGLHEEEM